MGRRAERVGWVLGAVALLVLGLGVPAASAADGTITSSGPITEIVTGQDLTCQVRHTGDALPELFDDGSGPSCGTVLATGGVVYGFLGVPFTLVSQVTTDGTGPLAGTAWTTTVVDAGSTGLRLTQVDTYTDGFERYRTDVTVANSGGAAVAARLSRVGDCFLQGDDLGYGLVDGEAVACRGAVPAGGGTFAPGPRLEQWRPISPGSTFVEDHYVDVFDAVAAQAPFPNTCACSSRLDNGAGLSWGITVPAHGSATRSHELLFSPTGVHPLDVALVPDSTGVSPGASTGYDVRVTNANGGTVEVARITLELDETGPAPAVGDPGFTYRPGTTSGLTTADPVVTGKVLRWEGPFAVPAGGTGHLRLGVRAATTPGTYEAGAAGTDADGHALHAPGGAAEATASIRVGDDPPPTTTTTTAPGATTTTTAPGTPTTTATTVPGAPTTTTTTVPTRRRASGAVPLADPSRGATPPGGTTTVTAGGFAPGSTGTVVLTRDGARTGSPVGAFSTSSVGSVVQSLRVPGRLAPGLYHVTFTGVDAQGNVRRVVVPVRVGAAASRGLPRTGTTGPDWRWGLLLVGVGLVLVGRSMTAEVDLRHRRRR